MKGKFDYTGKFKPRPTTYKGIAFRSKLEATWAAFFDLCGWKWEYEPALDIPGWDPDFLIQGKIFSVLVEVKPLTQLEDAFTLSESLFKKVGATSYVVLVVGCSPLLGEICDEKIGVTCGNQGWNVDEVDIHSAYSSFLDLGPNTGMLGIMHGYSVWGQQCIITGERAWSKGSSPRPHKYSVGTIESLWDKAKRALPQRHPRGVSA